MLPSCKTLTFPHVDHMPPRCSFYVPSRVDLAAMISEEHDGDDIDDVAKILEKLRRSEEDNHEEAKLLAWMQSQQEARAKRLVADGS